MNIPVDATNPLGMRARVAALVILALNAVVLVFLVAGHGVLAGHGDPVLYIEGAKDLRHYDSAFHPPLYSASIALVALVVRDFFLAAKLVSLLSALDVVCLTWLLGKACFDSDRVALLGTALVAMSPIVLRYGYAVGSDMLGAALFLGAAYALARSTAPSRRYVVVAGLLAGFAYLSRYVYATLLPAALLFYLCLAAGRLRERMVACGLFLVGFLVVVSPWSVVSIVRHGDLHNLNHINVAFAVLDTGDSWVRFDTYQERYPTLLSLIASHPAAVARHVAKNAFHFPADVVVRYGLVAGTVLLLGFLWALRRPTAARAALMLCTGLLLLATLLTWFDRRFFVPFMPVILLMGSYVILAALPETAGDFWPQTAPGWLRRLPLRMPVVVLAVAVTAGVAVRQVPSDFAKANIDDEKKMGRFLLDHTPEDTPLLTTSMNLAWYAHRPYVNMGELRDLTSENLEQAVRQTSAKVIVYTKRHGGYVHPELDFLLDPEDSRVPSSFRLLYHLDGEWPATAYWIEN